ncbi:MAG: magnesium transporter CorA family protein [Lachnospiraceae bacterium]|nr:magnesium transporter CorA family protein [Lachnospiraceae bacterium]MBP3610916.1 magnesium transporter CorA family protein [Lachnospiraceae bacterium]
MIEIFKTMEGNHFEQIDTVEKDCWISMTNPTPQEIHQISSICQVEEDVLRAALDAEERARIEAEDEYTLILIDIPAIEKEIVEKQEKDRFITMPLAIVHLEAYIITVCLVETPVLTHIKSGRMKGFSTHKKTRFILQIFYRVATLFLQYLRTLNRQSEAIEDRLHVSQKNKELFELLELQKSLVYFTTSLRSNEGVFEKMLRNEKVKRYPDDEDLLEDVIIENKQAMEMANIYNGILSGMVDTFASVISNNLNIVMKFLATVTIVMSIPTMIASFYGMNVPLPGHDNPYGFYIVLGFAVLLAFIVALILHKKDVF